MRRPHLRRLARCLLSLTAVAACATGPAYTIGPDNPPPPPPVEAGPAEIPPQNFAPARHEARVHPVAEVATLSSIPAVSTRGKCVAAGAVPEGRPGGSKPRPKKAKKKRGHVPYRPEKSASAAKKPSSTPAQPTAPMGGAAAPEPEPAAMDAGADLDRAEAAPPPAEEDATRSRSDREERKARRKAKRSRSKDALAPATASAPMDDDAGEAQFEQEIDEAPPLQQVERVAWPPEGEGWGGATYLSNDDSMSMSSPQRVRFAIDNDLPLPLSHIRTHELLNAASFELAEVEQGHDFSVHAQIAPSRRENGLYSLALAVNGRPVGREGRRNAAITFVIDRSGSMKAEGRMEFVKRGLLRMVRELKTGDVINIVAFDQRVCTRLENFVVGRDDAAVLTKAITGIKPSGSTNLHAGLTKGYQLADAAYQPKYSNRVVIITDALANRGVTDPRTLSMVSDFYDARRIRLSGVGVGKTFDDRLLDALTEKGRGAYVFLGSEAQVEHVFGAGFTSLVETTANDVHYRLHLPVTMRMQQFYGEEASVSKAEVQAVHFFADTSQVLLSDVEAWQGRLRPQDGILLEVEYQHPETGETMTEEYAFSVAEMTERSTNVQKAEVLMHFAQNLEDMVRNFGDRGGPESVPFGGRRAPQTSPAGRCQDVERELGDLAQNMRDAEVAEVRRLWTKFCGRYGAAPTGRPPRKR